MDPSQFTQPSGHVLLPMYSMPDKRSRETINYKDLSLIFLVFISWSKSSSVEVPPERLLSHTTIRGTIRASGPKVTHLSDEFILSYDGTKYLSRLRACFSVIYALQRLLT